MNDQASIPRMNIPDTEEELFEKIASAMKVLDGLIKKDGAAIQNLRAVRMDYGIQIMCDINRSGVGIETIAVAFQYRRN